MYISTEQFDFRFEIDERGNSDGDTGLFFYIRYEKKCARILHNSRLCVCINLFCIVSARFRFSFLGSILAHFFSHFVFFLLLLHTAQFRIYHVLIIAQILPQYLKCFFLIRYFCSQCFQKWLLHWLFQYYYLFRKLFSIFKLNCTLSITVCYSFFPLNHSEKKKQNRCFLSQTYNQHVLKTHSISTITIFDLSIHTSILIRSDRNFFSLSFPFLICSIFQFLFQSEQKFCFSFQFKSFDWHSVLAPNSK